MAHLTARPLSPPHPSQSPTTNTPNGIPPHKRPRLSPNPPSPYGPNSSVSNGLTSNISLPGSGFNFNGTTPTPAQGPGTMGPPSKPVEKATDTTELADVLISSGIDLKDEESFLTSSYNTTNRQANNASFNSAQSSQSTPGTLSANNSFSASLGSAGEGIFAVAGALSGPPAPYTSVDDLAKHESSKALRVHQEWRSHHLNNSFLQSKALWTRVFRVAYENNIQTPAGDTHPQPHHTQSTLTGSDGSKIVAVTGTVIPADSPLSEVLALLSLAAGERIRGLVEDAVTLAKGRREGSDGVVPSEWSDLSEKLRADTPATNTRAGWESAVSPRTNPLKRPLSSNDKSANTQPDTSSTVTYPNEIAKTLREIAKKEQEAEDSWLARRSAKLQKTSNSADGSVTGSVGPSTPAPGTPSTTLLGERAPEIDSSRKTSVKEQRKQQASKLEEFNQHRSANTTANMMLGTGGLFGKGKKKQYAWMTSGGVGSSPGTPRANTNVAGSPGFEGAGTTSSGGPWKRLGTWKEDREQGAGVQLRDWISALEADGREKKALVKAYAKLRK